MAGDKVLNWLLEESQPSVRYLALTQLLGRKESDSEVRKARGQIPTKGWAAALLARRDASGWWIRPKGWLEPRFAGTNWNMLALSDLRASRQTPEIEASAEFWMNNSPLQGGGVGGFGKGKGHHCYTANMARALIRMGYEDDPRVRRTLDWLVRTAHPNGGWSCRFSTNGPATSRTLDAWEGLSAFAAYPRTKWTAEMERVVNLGAEYYLERELHVQGDRYEPWYRLHWPNHYYYDLLVGLDTLTALGYADDPRLKFALNWLKKKRRADGRWNLDANLPDYDTEALQWLAKHPEAPRATPMALESAGQPSKMITLRARAVLSRVNE